MDDLRQRGQGWRESGAFLLADAVRRDRVVRSWIPYGVLSPQSLAYPYIRLEPAAFARLWSACRENQLEVVADIHTHPGGPRQSPSDRAHPMVALPGHVALIAPRFALHDPRPIDCSFNVYLGNHLWVSLLRRDAETHIIAP